MKKSLPKPFRHLFPTLGNLLWITAFFLVLIIGRNMMNGDGDLGFHLTLGRYIIDNRQIPLHDVFSHSMSGLPVTQHEWLSTVLLAGLERQFGFTGIVVFSALVISTAFWMVYLRSRSVGGSFTALAVGFLAMLSSMLHWLTRPHILTFLFLGLWIYLLDRLHRVNHRIWWVFPLLMLFWTNLHGAFIVGFMTWFLYGLGLGWDQLWGRFPEGPKPSAAFWRSFLLAGATSWLVSLINPSGIGLWQKVIAHAGNRYLASRTIEFQSPNFHWISTWPFLIFTLILLLVLAFSYRKYRSELIFNAIAWLALALYGARNIPLFVIVTAPLLVQGIENTAAGGLQKFKFVRTLIPKVKRIMNIDQQLFGYFWPAVAILLVTIGLALGFRFHPEGQDYRFDPEIFPVDAVNWLKKNTLEGEMLNYYTWGGYLQFRLWPEKKVFIDGKADFYGEAFIQEYTRLVNLEGNWDDTLDRYSIDWVIFPPETALLEILQCQSGWKTVYMDETAVIITRQPQADFNQSNLPANSDKNESSGYCE